MILRAYHFLIIQSKQLLRVKNKLTCDEPLPVAYKETCYKERGNLKFCKKVLCCLPNLFAFYWKCSVVFRNLSTIDILLETQHIEVFPAKIILVKTLQILPYFPTRRCLLYIVAVNNPQLQPEKYIKLITVIKNATILP